MKRAAALLLFPVPLAVAALFSGYGIDRGYPTALYALTRAIVEERTLCLDGQKELLGYDHAIYRGRLYSDKAPGPAFLMIPAYLLARRVATDPDLVFTLTLLLGLTLPAVTAPLGVLALLRRSGSGMPLLGAWSFAFGSLFLPYATVGISDALAAAAVAWALALALGKPGAELVLAGCAAGFAILVRYQAALLVAPLALYVLLTHGRRSWRFLVPLALLVALALAYNAAAFDSPFTFPTYHWRGKPGGAPTLQMERPTPRRAFEMTLGLRRGLLVYTPLLLLVPAGSVAMLRKNPLLGAAALAGIALHFGYLLCNRGWVGGADYGMRFSLVALPLLWMLAFHGHGVLWARVAAILLVPSAALALLATLAGPFVPFLERNPIAFKARELMADGPRTILDRAPRSPQPKEGAR